MSIDCNIGSSRRWIIIDSFGHLQFRQTASRLLIREFMSEADDLQRRAEAFADVSIRFVQGLPRTLIAQRMGGQYLDSSTSVAANYRAARRGRSYDEFTAKLGLVSEEADESVFWLIRFKNAGISSNVDLPPLLAEAQELAKIFGASARTARGRRRRRRNRDDDPAPR